MPDAYPYKPCYNLFQYCGALLTTSPPLSLKIKNPYILINNTFRESHYCVK